jgi:carboxyl-terminal processing protease
VPVNEDTIARSMAGEDVQLTYAVKWPDEQVKRGTPPAPLATTTLTIHTSLGIGIVVMAVGLLIMMAGKK